MSKDSIALVNVISLFIKIKKKEDGMEKQKIKA